MDKITPDLLEVLERRERVYAGALARGDQATAAVKDAPIQVSVAFDGPADALVSAGFPLGSLVANAASGGLSPALIRQLAKLPLVHMIGLPPDLRLKLDKSVPEIHANAAWSAAIGAGEEARGKGDGVIIGIVDSGIDVYHGAFQNADGTSRILRLWDQTFNYDSGTGVPVDSEGDPITGDMLPKDENGAVLTQARAPTDLRVASDVSRPQLFTNGAQFLTGQINTALTAHPDGKNLPVSLRDDPSHDGDETYYHGTHVAGIAAGNGAQNDKCTSAFTYVGVAPKAQLVIVKTGTGSTPKRIKHINDAVEYIFRVAARENPPNGRPCVVNVSIDSHFGQHNGNSEDSRALDTMVTGPLGVGRAVVVAAGNERDGNIHAAFSIPRGTTQTVRLLLIASGKPRVSLWASHNPGADITCIVRAPGPPPVQQTVALMTNAVNLTDVPVGTLSAIAHGSQAVPTVGDPDQHFWISVRDPAGLPTGVWDVDIMVGAGSGDAMANVHFWVATPSDDDMVILPFVGAVASPQDAGRGNAAMRRPETWIGATIGIRASTRSVIAVAAYNAEVNPTTLDEASSQGPAPNNLALGLYDRSPDGSYAKPDIAAPGVNVDAPRAEARKCCLECDCCVDRYVAESGTSMAAPHITGVIALMFARNPALTPTEIKTLLSGTQRNPPSLPPGWPPSADLWGAGKVDANAAVLAAPRVMAPEAEVVHEPPVPEPQVLPIGWPERLRAWSDILGGHPAWNLCAALVSQHFDEVKRLIDTNRRVAAIWQRHGGPALVRGIAFAARPPDPPLPATAGASSPLTLMTRLFKVLTRYGGDTLRADIARYAPLMQALPGASWNELDEMIGGRA